MKFLISLIHNKRIPYFIFVTIIIMALNTSAMIYVKRAAFPFITMKYAYTENKFNYNDLDIAMRINPKLKKNIISELKPLLPTYVPNSDTVFQYSGILAKYVRSHLYQRINTVHDIAKILNSSKEYPAICSGYSKVLAYVAQALGFKSRVIWMNGHTVSEVFYPDYGWVLVDANGNLMFREKKKYISLIDVVVNFNDAVPVRLVAASCCGNDDPDYLLSNNYTVYRKNNIIVVIEGSRLFDFDIRTKSPIVLLKYILGIDNVAEGIQYVSGREKLGNLRRLFQIIAIMDLLFLIFVVVFFIKSKIKRCEQ